MTYDPLCIDTIKSSMLFDAFPVQWQLLPEVASTNQYLLDSAAKQPAQQPVICLAESQTAGRGQHQRSWLSEPGQLTLSLLWPWQKTAKAQPSVLGVAAAVALAQTLSPLLTTTIMVKWPNDLQIAEKKLAGILLEAQSRGGERSDIVIGIGLNVNKLSDDKINSIKQPVCCLQDYARDKLDRNQLCAAVVSALLQACSAVQGGDAQKYLQHWHRYDVLFERRIEIDKGDSCIAGVAKGIDASGALLLHDGSNNRVIVSGSVRLL